MGMLIFTVFAVWAIQYIRKFSIPYWVKMRQMSSQFYGFLGEHLEGTEDTRANGATPYVMGSGKTTLARLLLRFYDPLDGGIYLDDVNIRELTLQQLRRKVGLITRPA